MSWRVDGGVRLADGTWQVRLLHTDGTRRVATVLPGSDAHWVAIEGEVSVVPVAPAPGAPRRRSADDHSLAAPMPATVIRILVEPGQAVARGDVLLLLEAMKMELPIRAPKDGTVRAIDCAAGELVQAGVSLLEIE